MNDEESLLKSATPTFPSTQWVRKRVQEQGDDSSKVSDESSDTAPTEPPHSAAKTNGTPEAESPSRATLLMLGVAALLLVSVFSGVVTLGALLILR